MAGRTGHFYFNECSPEFYFEELLKVLQCEQDMSCKE